MQRIPEKIKEQDDIEQGALTIQTNGNFTDGYGPYQDTNEPQLATATTTQYPRSLYGLGLEPETITRTIENSKAFRNAQTRNVSQVGFFSQISIGCKKNNLFNVGVFILANAFIVASSALGAFMLEYDTCKVGLVTAVGAPILTTVATMLVALSSSVSPPPERGGTQERHECVGGILAYSALAIYIISVISPGPVGQLILHSEPDENIKNRALIASSFVGTLVSVPSAALLYALTKAVSIVCRDESNGLSNPSTDDNENTLTPTFDY